MLRFKDIPRFAFNTTTILFSCGISLTAIPRAQAAMMMWIVKIIIMQYRIKECRRQNELLTFSAAVSKILTCDKIFGLTTMLVPETTKCIYLNIIELVCHYFCWVIKKLYRSIFRWHTLRSNFIITCRFVILCREFIRGVHLYCILSKFQSKTGRRKMCHKYYKQ